ncbi:MAG: transglycosylase SLT domain-containing protein [Paludibacter sp.]|nr:transglycosylase SLT domain-containing protein [Paludibacter sp.]
MPAKLLWLLLFVFYACEFKETGSVTVPDAGKSPVEKTIRDTLHVATMYGSSSYFNFRDEIMGNDYEMADDLASYAGRPLKIHLAKSTDEMLKMLRERKVDIIAYSIYETKALKDKFRFVAFQEDSYMVLVQRIGLKNVSDIHELTGKTVYVIENSVYHERLENLNKELGGGINIQTVSDTVSVDRMIEMVADKKIEYTVAHHKTANQHRNFNRRLDCRIEIGFQQKNGWLIREDDEATRNLISKWEKDPDTELLKSQLYGKYNYRNPYFISQKLLIPKGAISPYDVYFKRYAPEIKWDWRLLAAVAFHESGFDSAQVSRKGASGLMQLMPRTAANFGLSRSNILNPEKNIEASVQYIKSLNLLFRKVGNAEERVKFILASYNSGPAHVLDAMALAEKYGKNPYIWFGHVEYYLSRKHEPEIYNDEVVKYGYFSSAVTLKYVRNTLDTYNKYKGRI